MGLTLMELVKPTLAPDSIDPSIMWQNENWIIPIEVETFLVAEEITFDNQVKNLTKQFIKKYKRRIEGLQKKSKEEGFDNIECELGAYGVLRVVDPRDITYIYTVKKLKPVRYYQAVIDQVQKHLVKLGIPARIVDFDRQAFLAWCDEQEFATDTKESIAACMETWTQVRASEDEHYNSIDSKAMGDTIPLILPPSDPTIVAKTPRKRPRRMRR